MKMFLKFVRPNGGPPSDVVVADGRIQRIAPAGELAPDADATIIDGAGAMLLPALVNAHAHLDKNLLGYPWHKNRVPGKRIRDFVDNERAVRKEMNLSAQVQAERQMIASLATGTTHIRTHVDIDTDAGLQHWEGVLATREKYRHILTMQCVAFPQSGMLVRPGTVELMEAAVRNGADAVGGLDPSTIDRDPARHIDTVFALADRHGKEVDIHLHEPGMLGAFSVELIADRTRALGMQGKVVISHCFCLGQVDEPYLAQLIELLAENRIAIMSLGSGVAAFPPLLRLREAGIAVCTGTDGIRDTWGPYNSHDLLDRVKMLGYRSGLRKDEDVEQLLDIATFGGALVMGLQGYGLKTGDNASFYLVAGNTPTQAVIEMPPRALVVSNGRIVARNGNYHQLAAAQSATA